MWHGVVVSHASTTSTLAINIGFALPGGLVIVLSVVVSLAFAFQLTSRLTPAASKPGDLKAAPWQGAAAAVIDPVFSIPRLDVAVPGPERCAIRLVQPTEPVLRILQDPTRAEPWCRGGSFRLPRLRSRRDRVLSDALLRP